MKVHEAASQNTGHRAKSVLSCCIDIMAKLVDDANGSAVRRRKMELEKEPENKASERKKLAMLEQRSGYKLLVACFVGIFVSYFIYALLQEKIKASERKKLAMLEQRSGYKLLVACFVGIFVSYFIYALLQEKITKQKFGDEYFRYFGFLVGIQCIINASIAKLVCKFRNLEVSLQPYRLFGVLSFVYVGAMVSSNSSLAWITYPTQVLGKSAKPIPVMIFGVLVGHRSYPLIKYLIVLLIVAGVALFLYKDGGASRHGNSDDQWRLFHIVGIGELLVLLSLMFDGLTGVFQDKLKAKHSVHSLHMMFAVNVYAAVYVAIGVVVTGEGMEAVGFVQRHPEVLFNILVFGIASAIGQIFIFSTITNFGPLTCSIFTTTRKFFTILGSVIIFSNPLLPRQWGGVALVFVGLGLNSYFGHAKPKTTSSSDITASSSV